MEENHIKTVNNQIKEHFNIQREVWGTHFSGKRLRIDAVLTPKDTSEWKNKNIALGVEYKDLDRIQDAGMVNFTKFIAQAVDYSHTKFDGYGYIPVFCQTDFSVYGNSREFKFVFPRILSGLGIGQFYKHKYYGWSFWWQGEHRIWSDKNGIERGKHYKLERKFGSR